MTKFENTTSINELQEIFTETQGNSPLLLPDELFEKTPGIVNNYMQYATPLSDTPNEFLLLPFLTISGALIGRKRFIVAGGSKILPIVWVVLFAGSSTMRKSTSINIAKKPFKDIEGYLYEEYKKRLKKWEKLDKEAQDDGRVKIPKPKRKTLFAPDGFSDLTFWETLRDSQSVVSIASEFTGLWTELNKTYNGLSDLALKLFDGEGGRRVTKSGGDIVIKEPVWCIVGATTIENFRKGLTSTERGSGFLQRIIPICMVDNPKSFRSILDTADEDQKLRKEITNTLHSISALPRNKMEISKDAENIYRDWSHKLHEQALGLENNISDIGGYYSRLSIYALKFALIFQVLEFPKGNITKKNMEASIILCEWVKQHILYMLTNNYIFDQAYADRVKIKDIIGKQPDERISRTDLMNNSHFSKQRLDKALGSEVESGNIGSESIKTEGKTRTEYYLK